jgi:hypothetical protein
MAILGPSTRTRESHAHVNPLRFQVLTGSPSQVFIVCRVFEVSGKTDSYSYGIEKARSRGPVREGTGICDGVQHGVDSLHQEQPPDQASRSPLAIPAGARFPAPVDPLTPTMRPQDAAPDLDLYQDIWPTCHITITRRKQPDCQPPLRPK